MLSSTDGSVYLTAVAVHVSNVSINSAADVTISVLHTSGSVEVSGESVNVSALSGSIMFQSSDTSGANKAVAANFSATANLLASYNVGFDSVDVAAWGA